MKYLMLLLLIGCSGESKHSKHWEHGPVYGTKVQIIESFYYNQIGIIKDKTFVWDDGCGCGVAGYEIQLQDGKLIKIGQSKFIVLDVK